MNRYALTVFVVSFAASVGYSDFSTLAGEAKGVLSASASPKDTTSVLGSLANDNAALTEMGKLAAEKSSSAAVKDYAKSLVANHVEAAKSIASAAKTEGVSVTNQTTGVSSALLQKLKGQSGSSFDKAFLEQAMVTQIKSLATAKAASSASSPALQSLAGKLTPGLQKGLDSAKSLQSAMGNLSKPAAAATAAQ